MDGRKEPGNEPVRTCLACRRRAAKELLLRFALVNGEPARDAVGTLAGRGAYCCDNATCLQRFYKDRKRLARAFRVHYKKATA